MENISKEESDVIGEISNISLGSSATAMSKMLGQPIKITTPNVSLVHRDEILVDYENSCILVKVQYTQGLSGTNLLVLRDNDAKIITDLMMGNDGNGAFAHGSSATAMNKMFNKKIDISPPTVEQIVIGEYDFSNDIPDEQYVKINFRMTIGDLIDSTFMQLYPLELAHTIYNLFQRRN
jgi:flagellar motor switch protein FliN/FliY